MSGQEEKSGRLHYTRQREESEASPCAAFSLRRSSFCYGSFYTSLFRLFEIHTNTGATTSKGEETRRKKRKRRQKGKDRERERGEENGKVLSFFWMSQAQVRRREKDEQEAERSRGEAVGEKERYIYISYIYAGERKEREEGRRREIAQKREASSNGLAGREHEDPKRGQRENDKGERGGRFDWKGRQRGLFPFTSVFSVLRSVLSVVPTCAHRGMHS